MDPLPPWLVFSNAEPQWSGWRQGVGEEWLLTTWLPFWRGLTAAARQDYLRRWPPPDANWSDHLTYPAKEDRQPGGWVRTPGIGDDVTPSRNRQTPCTTRDTHRPPRTPVIEARTLGIDNNTKALISHQNKSYPEDSGDHTNMQINPNSLITKVLSDKPSSPCQKQGGSRRGNGRWARSTTYCLHTVGRQP
jgi:hypothetical protein